MAVLPLRPLRHHQRRRCSAWAARSARRWRSPSCSRRRGVVTLQPDQHRATRRRSRRTSRCSSPRRPGSAVNALIATGLVLFVITFAGQLRSPAAIVNRRARVLGSQLMSHRPERPHGRDAELARRLAAVGRTGRSCRAGRPGASSARRGRRRRRRCCSALTGVGVGLAVVLGVVVVRAGGVRWPRGRSRARARPRTGWSRPAWSDGVRSSRWSRWSRWSWTVLSQRPRPARRRVLHLLDAQRRRRGRRHLPRHHRHAAHHRRSPRSSRSRSACSPRSTSSSTAAGSWPRAITFLVDVMTGIPSIVAGLFAYALFVLFFGPGVRLGFVRLGRAVAADDPGRRALHRGDAQARARTSCARRRTPSACRSGGRSSRSCCRPRSPASSPASCWRSPASSARPRRC